MQKAELEAAGAANPARIISTSPRGKGKSGFAKGKQAAAAAVINPPKADPEAIARFKNRPKGGVKVLSGTEGSLSSKRPLEDATGAEPAAKK